MRREAGGERLDFNSFAMPAMGRVKSVGDKSRRTRFDSAIDFAFYLGRYKAAVDFASSTPALDSAIDVRRNTALGTEGTACAVRK